MDHRKNILYFYVQHQVNGFGTRDGGAFTVGYELNL